MYSFFKFMLSGDGKTKLIMESSSLVILNYLLAKVVYTSTIYHIHTGDLGMKTLEARNQNLSLQKLTAQNCNQLSMFCAAICICIHLFFCVFNVHLEKLKSVSGKCWCSLIESVL